MLLYHEERDLELREETEVSVKERDRVGDLNDGVVLRRDFSQQHTVDSSGGVLERV
jgi:hypothetical protein